MKYLEKTWIRLLVCLLLGGFLAEMVHLKFGTAQFSNLITVSSALFIFFILTFILRIRSKKRVDTLSSKEDILDA